MDDDIGFDSDDAEQEYAMTAARASRNRLAQKRPAREMEEEEEEEEKDADDVVEDDDQEEETEVRTTSHSGSRSRVKATAESSRTGTGSSRRAGAGSLDADEQLEDVDKPTFRPETMQAIFKGIWAEAGTKAGKEAMQLSAEYLRLFTIEALHRTAAYQREQEDEELRNDETLIELDSLEAITPQLVLDF
ncbi:hypothetical protein EDD11_002192 [Mortierella claussenii]|nr:hypothetical protein EDD11_002192 [Mortierella claussenii]